MLLEPKLALGDQLLLIDRQAPRALLLDVGDDQLPGAAAERRAAARPALRWEAQRQDEALVLCTGRRASAARGRRARRARRARERRRAAHATCSAATRSTRSSQSDDGRVRVPVQARGCRAAARQPERDRDRRPRRATPDDDGAIALRTLRSFGDSPLVGGVLADDAGSLGEERRLAVVLSQSNVTLIDLDHLDRVETTVQLSSAGRRARSRPRRCCSTPTRRRSTCAARAPTTCSCSTSSERPAASSDEDGEPHNDFRPFIDQLGVGGRPSDMALYAPPTTARACSCWRTAQTAAVVEAGTSQVTTRGAAAGGEPGAAVHRRIAARPRARRSARCSTSNGGQRGDVPRPRGSRGARQPQPRGAVASAGRSPS